MKKSLLFALLGTALLCSSCASVQTDEPPPLETLRGPGCRVPTNSFDGSDIITALDLLTELFEARCDRKALALGQWIRRNFRDKSYSVTREVTSVFVPEESASSYVLESYERAYLALLMAAIYWNNGNRDAAAVELRKSYSEGKALIYNYGDDEPNLLLAATLWENLGEIEMARPFWKKLSEIQASNEAKSSARAFAMDRIRSIDEGKKMERPWRILAVGRFPELDWGINFGRKGGSYYEVKTAHSLPKYCRSAFGTMIPTEAWLNKIRARYDSDYHPLLHLKSWVRVPIGIMYGLTTFTAGVGIAVGGCGLDGYARGNGEFCRQSSRAGVELIKRSGDVADFAMRPDLRHWRRVPAAIVVTQAPSMNEEDCWRKIDESNRLIAIELFRPADLSDLADLNVAPSK